MTCPWGASRDSPGMKQVGGRQGAPWFPVATRRRPRGSRPCLWSVGPPAPHACPGLHVGVVFCLIEHILLIPVCEAWGHLDG